MPQALLKVYRQLGGGTLRLLSHQFLKLRDLPPDHAQAGAPEVFGGDVQAESLRQGLRVRRARRGEQIIVLRAECFRLFEIASVQP